MATKYVYTTKTRSGPITLEFTLNKSDSEEVRGMLDNIRQAFVAIVDLKTKVELQEQITRKSTTTQ